jgi:sugar (pentulose or hexulose) kinase
MSVIGIDFGAQSTKIGVARNKGIDIVRIFACPSKNDPLSFHGIV